MNIPKLNKLKTSITNDFNGFIEKPNKNQKKDLLENNLRRPLVIINPIFDSEIQQNYDIDVNSLNTRLNTINQDNVSNSNLIRKHVNISDKISVGFIV